MERHGPGGRRRLRWSVATLMAVVAVSALLMTSLRPIFQERVPENLLPPAPGYVLDRLPQRMQNLRPGMTEERVWWELGLTRYRRQARMSRGPRNRYLTTYSLGSGYRLHLRCDHTMIPPRLIGGELYQGGGMAASFRPAARQPRPGASAPAAVVSPLAGPVR